MEGGFHNRNHPVSTLTHGVDKKKHPFPNEKL